MGFTRLLTLRGFAVRTLLVAIGFLLAISSLYADFENASRLTGGLRGASGVAVAHDIAGNVYVVSIVDGHLRIDLFGPCLQTEPFFPGGTDRRGEPQVVTGSRGEAVVCFTERRSAAADAPRDIYLTHNAGGPFTDPVRLSDSPHDDYAPHLTLDLRGNAHVVWSRQPADPEAPPLVLYYNPLSERIETVAPGRLPSLCLDSRGTVHLVYQRDDRLYCNSNTGGIFDRELEIEGTPATMEPGAAIAGTRDGRLVISYTDSGSLYLLEGSQEADFGTATEIDSGGITRADLEAGRSAGLSLVYSRDGDIYKMSGSGSSDLELEHVVPFVPDRESGPRHAVDSCDITHVVFLRDGEVYYTNDAQDPVPDFSADRTHGEIPLVVQFEDLSEGKVQGWHWDFGDGGTSLSRDPQYTYDEPGSYTVTLSVFLTNRTSVELKREFVVAEEPSNTLTIPDQRLEFGQGEVWFPVYASHRDPVMAYQLHGVFDPEVLEMQGCSLLGTPSVRLRPEVWECNIFESSFEIGCLYDFTPPIDGRALPPGDDHILTNLIFTVASEGSEETITRIDLINDREQSPILNIFTVNNRSKIPVMTGSTVTVYPEDHPEQLFIRGDINFTGNVDITDAIYLLSFLFLGFEDPECLDTADTLDEGRINISSPIYLLNFLFTGGPAPRVPYPSPGLDPTPDDAFHCED